MKTLTRIFYDILLKIPKSKSELFEINKEILKTYFEPAAENNTILFDDLGVYFNTFYNFCFELKSDNMLKGHINFKYKV